MSSPSKSPLVFVSLELAPVVTPMPAVAPTAEPDVNPDEPSADEGCEEDAAPAILLSRRRTGGSVLPFSWDVPKLEIGLEQELAKKTPLSGLWAKRLVKALYLDIVKYITDM